MDGRVSLVVVVLLLLEMVAPSLSSLDPKELAALKSMNIPMNVADPCSKGGVGVCDAGHLVSLLITNCSVSDRVSLSTSAFQSLAFLTDLQFISCPGARLVRLPPSLSSNLKSFSSLNSLKFYISTGVWLSRLANLTSLTVSATPITASGPPIILNSLHQLTNLTLSNTNLTGSLPDPWDHNPKITHIDLSLNNLNGPIPSYIGSMSTLVHLDLSSNHFNGSIPDSLAKLKGLKYLNLESNNFQGVMPFTETFIKRLDVFKVGDNANLCYNKSSISHKIKLGISPCDKNGLPITQDATTSPSPSPGEDSADDQTTPGDETSNNAGSGDSHGPNKVVLGVAIALSCIVLLIIFLIILAKRCT